MRRHDGGLGRLARRARRGARAVRQRRAAAGARSTLSSQEVEEYYEGFSNATLWPLYHDVIATPEFHREWWDSLRRGQPAVRRPDRRGRRHRTRWSGCRTTSSSSCRRCCASSGRTCGSGSSCTSPSRRPSSTSSCPGATRSSRACSVPTWSVSSCPAAPRTSSAWSGSGCGWRPSGTGSTCPTAARWWPGPTRSPSTPKVCNELAGHPGGRRTGRRDPHATSVTPGMIFLGVDRLDYTKGLLERIRAFGELIDRGQDRRRRSRPGAAGHPVAGDGSTSTASCATTRPAGRPDQRRRRTDRSAADHLPAHLLPARRRWPRSTAPPTSWWSPRCATG